MGKLLERTKLYNGIKKTYKSPNNGFLEVGSKQIIMINEKGESDENKICYKFYGTGLLFSGG